MIDGPAIAITGFDGFRHRLGIWKLHKTWFWTKVHDGGEYKIKLLCVFRQTASNDSADLS